MHDLSSEPSGINKPVPAGAWCTSTSVYVFILINVLQPSDLKVGLLCRPIGSVQWIVAYLIWVGQSAGVKPASLVTLPTPDSESVSV